MEREDLKKIKKISVAVADNPPHNTQPTTQEKEIKTMTNDEFFDFLVEYGIATEEEILLVSKINGYNEETLNDILYVRTGNRSVEQFLEEIEL